MNESFMTGFDRIVERAKKVEKPMRVAIAAADAENIVRGAFLAQDAGFVEPILIGNGNKIRAVLENIGQADRDVTVIDASGGDSSVQFAIEMINSGDADCLMRGNSSTRDFLMPVLNKSNHLIVPDTLVTHINFLKVPGLERMVAISDVTLLINPPMEARKQVVKNMVKALNAFDVEKPNIALLALVEKPSYHMRDTVEDQTMVRENEKRPFADCNLVGPIAYDLIVSKEAARLKGYDCPYCGEFDGIVVPNLATGNVMVKVLQQSAGADGFGVLVGAKIPIAITSRADKPEQAFYSLAACAAMWSAPAYKKFFD
ncbi:MAG: phosphate acyltransferase [Eubacteriales bacterium]|nr:phosphate acyltransferase [Eubacteriales bacterium]